MELFGSILPIAECALFVISALILAPYALNILAAIGTKYHQNEPKPANVPKLHAVNSQQGNSSKSTVSAGGGGSVDAEDQKDSMMMGAATTHRGDCQSESLLAMVETEDSDEDDLKDVTRRGHREENELSHDRANKCDSDDDDSDDDSDD